MKMILDLYDPARRYGDFEAAKLVKDAGFDGVDYPFYGTMPQQEMDHYRAFKEHLNQLGLCCPQAHAPFTMGYGMEFSESQPEYAAVLHSFQASALLGVEQIVVHALHTPEKSTKKEFEEYNYSYYKSL